MKIKLPILFLLMHFGWQTVAQVDLESSNLPILVITTENGAAIEDEPKMTAHLGIIWNGDGDDNMITDPYNNYNGSIGIEKRGSSSQSFPKVGYGFETRQADGTNNNVPLLGMPQENDWVLHGPYSDKSLMRNALAYILAGRIMGYAPRVRFCEVVLNDVYQGVYVLTEKIKRDKNRVDISQLTPDENDGDDLTGGYILKLDKHDFMNFGGFLSEYPSFEGGGYNTFFQYHYPKYDEITEAQEDYISGWIKAFEDMLQSEAFAHPTEGYRTYLDLPSFMQFVFINEIGRNVDGYRLSTFMYKDRDSQGGKLHFGPVWDFNLAFGNVDYCIGGDVSGWALDFNDFCPNDNWVIHFWWDRIWQDTEYLDEMKAYWKMLRENELSTPRVTQVIDSLENLLREPAKRNFKQWPVLGEYVWPNPVVLGTWQEEVARLRIWVAQRLAWMDQGMEILGNPDFDPYIFIQPETHPNPFRDKVTFTYYCIYRESVRFEIYNVQGQLVEHFSDDRLEAGLRKFDWFPSSNLPNGIYFYNMKFSRGERAAGFFVRS